MKQSKEKHFRMQVYSHKITFHQQVEYFFLILTSNNQCFATTAAIHL
jgi:hypothetical protein